MGKKKQTAVEWFFAQMPFEYSSSRAAFEARQTALAMEREQIITAYQSDRTPCSCEDAEQYYNETYGNPSGT
jgi:hypothetical protein